MERDRVLKRYGSEICMERDIVLEFVWKGYWEEDELGYTQKHDFLV